MSGISCCGLGGFLNGLYQQTLGPESRERTVFFISSAIVAYGLNAKGFPFEIALAGSVASYYLLQMTYAQRAEKLEDRVEELENIVAEYKGTDQLLQNILKLCVKDAHNMIRLVDARLLASNDTPEEKRKERIAFWAQRGVILTYELGQDSEYWKVQIGEYRPPNPDGASSSPPPAESSS